MEALVLFALIFIVVCFVLPIVAMTKASRAQGSVANLQNKVRDLEAQLHSLRRPGGAATPEKILGQEEPVTPPSAKTPEWWAEPKPTPTPPPPVPVLPQTAPRAAKEPASPDLTTPKPKPSPAAPPPPDVELPKIDWEQFMGAKLFAWIGGFALFLGVAFFVKYSFEHNLIPPEIRVAIGFVVGIGLVIGGVALKRKENRVTAQTLCATGILILYAVTFACRSYYHFRFFGLIPTFLLMSLITAAAFVLAVRLDAIVVAILGIAGGFLTPVLLSTGQDNPLGLFGYIALLDIGLLMVARRKDWSVLPILGGVGTVLMQMAWVTRFFVANRYFAENILVPMSIFIGFEMLFGLALAFCKRGAKSEEALSAAAIGIGAVAVGWAFYFLSFSPLGNRPVVLFSYAFVADIVLLAMAFFREKLARIGAVAGAAVFSLLGLWMARYLTSTNLYVALGFCFVFAVLHSAIPLLQQRFRRMEVPRWSHAFPALALILVFIPIVTLPAVSFLVWPTVLCLDLLAIVLAAATATLLPVLIVLLLTLGVIGGWIFRIPNTLTGLPSSLLLLGGFAIFFLAASVWASRRFAGISTVPSKLLGSLEEPANIAVQLPALSVALPFLLLIMTTLRLPLANPSPVFGLALVLVALLLGMAKILSIDLLPAVGLVCVLALEYAWHFQHFTVGNALLPFFWYIGFTALFTVFPFAFHRRFAASTAVWASAALAAPLHFFLIYQVIRTVYPNGMLGLVPAVLSLPALLGLFFLLRRTPVDSPTRNTQLALFGAAALFFITLIFPIQFERQWITLGWALEGAALCWLFRRVPNPGLRLAGTALLVVAFVRLALNPAVLSYHAHSATPIVNWYLYTYGITALALFAGARLLAPPRHLLFETNVQAILYALGTILVFLLLNIEIADFFSTPGTTTLTFQFSGDFARDMTYSIAWAGFALLLLIVGIRNSARPVRYASIGLLAATILKLFLHDLSQLEQLYRIAAFVVVAIVAMVASFLYQRFFGARQRQMP